MALPLEGLRVLDLASIMAGPYGATMLADMGADVIKIEPPRGDECRHLGPRIGLDSATFVGINRNKRGLVLDLTQPAGHLKQPWSRQPHHESTGQRVNGSMNDSGHYLVDSSTR